MGISHTTNTREQRAGRTPHTQSLAGSEAEEAHGDSTWCQRPAQSSLRWKTGMGRVRRVVQQRAKHSTGRRRSRTAPSKTVVPDTSGRDERMRVLKSQQPEDRGLTDMGKKANDSSVTSHHPAESKEGCYFSVRCSPDRSQNRVTNQQPQFPRVSFTPSKEANKGTSCSRTKQPGVLLAKGCNGSLRQGVAAALRRFRCPPSFTSNTHWETCIFVPITLRQRDQQLGRSSR